MEISINFAGTLARLFQQKRMTVEIEEGQNLLFLIDNLETMLPGIKSELCDHDTKIKDSINIYVNGDNVRYLEELRTILNDGDQINIIPAAAAG
jgi:molybdopterin synthase sulfur carrier subunit